MQNYFWSSPKRFDTNNTEAIPTSPKVQAQCCELAIIANQLILKVFLPYLKNCSGRPSSDGLLRRVISSVVDAGHTVLQAMCILHSTLVANTACCFLILPLWSHCSTQR